MKMTLGSTATTATERYIDNFPENSANGYGLYIEGGNAIGRSRLAAAVELQLFRQGISFSSKTPVTLSGDIKAAVDTDGKIELIKEYIAVDVLVLHGLGAEPLTLQEIETLYHVVCGRYEAMRPTIVTADHGYSELSAHMMPDGDDGTMCRAIVRRLRETTIRIAAA